MSSPKNSPGQPLKSNTAGRTLRGTTGSLLAFYTACVARTRRPARRFTASRQKRFCRRMDQWARSICKIVLTLRCRKINGWHTDWSRSTLHLPFGDRKHQFDADQQGPRTVKILEPQHGPRASPDFPMVLLDHVVEIFGQAVSDGHFTIGIDCFERREIGAACRGETLSPVPAAA